MWTYPVSGHTLWANKDANVILTVKNTGDESVPESDWNIEMQFIDLWGIGSDAIWTMVKKENMLVQKRNIIFHFPQVNSGQEMEITIPITLNMRNIDDTYMAFANQLWIYGNQVPFDIDYHNSEHRAHKDINICADIAGDEVDCLWNFFKFSLSYVSCI